MRYTILDIDRKFCHMNNEFARKSSLLPVYLVFFVDNFGFSLVFALFAPLLLGSQYQMFSSDIAVSTKNFLIGLLFAVFPFAQFFGAPFIGDLADHYGRKKAFYITLTGSVISYVLSAFSVISHSVVLLIISRLLSGFCAGNLGICLAAIADLSPTEKSRGKQYSYIAMTAGISWVISIVVGGYLSDSSLSEFFSPSLPFFISALLCLAALISIIFFFNETRATKEQAIEFHFFRGCKNILTSFKIIELRALYVIYLIWIIGWGTVIQWFTPFSIEKFGVAQEEIVWMLVLFGLSWSFGGVLINTIFLRKIGSKQISVICLSVTTILIWLCAILYQYQIFSVAFIVSAAFGGVVMSNLLNLISLSAPYHMQGKVMGLSQSTIAVGWIVGPLLSGVIADLNINTIYYFAAGAIVISLVLLVIHNYRHAQKRRV